MKIQVTIDVPKMCSEIDEPECRYYNNGSCLIFDETLNTEEAIEPCESCKRARKMYEIWNGD